MADEHSEPPDQVSVSVHYLACRSGTYLIERPNFHRQKPYWFIFDNYHNVDSDGPVFVMGHPDDIQGNLNEGGNENLNKSHHAMYSYTIIRTLARHPRRP